MSDVGWGVAVGLLTGALWVVGSLLHWHNIRQLEQLVAGLRRAARHAPWSMKKEEINAVPEEAEEPAPV
jgi:hypothetical protein